MTVYIECKTCGTENKRLHVESAYIQKNSGKGQQLNIESDDSPQHTFETFIDSNTTDNSIPQKRDLSTSSSKILPTTPKPPTPPKNLPNLTSGLKNSKTILQIDISLWTDKLHRVFMPDGSLFEFKETKRSNAETAGLRDANLSPTNVTSNDSISQNEDLSIPSEKKVKSSVILTRIRSTGRRRKRSRRGWIRRIILTTRILWRRWRAA